MSPRNVRAVGRGATSAPAQGTTARNHDQPKDPLRGHPGSPSPQGGRAPSATTSVKLRVPPERWDRRSRTGKGSRSSIKTEPAAGRPNSSPAHQQTHRPPAPLRSPPLPVASRLDLQPCAFPKVGAAGGPFSWRGRPEKRQRARGRWVPGPRKRSPNIATGPNRPRRGVPNPDSVVEVESPRQIIPYNKRARATPRRL